jgi:hypothetical protein
VGAVIQIGTLPTDRNGGSRKSGDEQEGTSAERGVHAWPGPRALHHGARRGWMRDSISAHDFDLSRRPFGLPRAARAGSACPGAAPCPLLAAGEPRPGLEHCAKSVDLSGTPAPPAAVRGRSQGRSSACTPTSSLPRSERRLLACDGGAPLLAHEVFAGAARARALRPSESLSHARGTARRSAPRADLDRGGPVS